MWIAIEGVDGAGKRTQTELLKARIEQSGLTCATLSFPRYGQTVFARSIADYLNGGFGALETIDPHLPALLYAGDRAESREMLLAAGHSADVLILDRYVASNLAYQSARVAPAERQAFVQWIAEIEHTANHLPRADLTLLLDVPVQTAADLVTRKGERDYTTDKQDLHERNTHYLATVRDVYLDLARAALLSQWATVPCTDSAGTLLSVETIHARIWQEVAAVLPAAPGQATPPA